MHIFIPIADTSEDFQIFSELLSGPSCLRDVAHVLVKPLDVSQELTETNTGKRVAQIKAMYQPHLSGGINRSQHIFCSLRVAQTLSDSYASPSVIAPEHDLYLFDPNGDKVKIGNQLHIDDSRRLHVFRGSHSAMGVVKLIHSRVQKMIKVGDVFPIEVVLQTLKDNDNKHIDRWMKGDSVFLSDGKLLLPDYETIKGLLSWLGELNKENVNTRYVKVFLELFRITVIEIHAIPELFSLSDNVRAEVEQIYNLLKGLDFSS